MRTFPLSLIATMIDLTPFPLSTDPFPFRLPGNAMNSTTLLSLPIEQRLHLVEELWDSIASDQGLLPVTDAQRNELDKRLDAYEKDGNPGRSAKDVLAEIRQRL